MGQLEISYFRWFFVRNMVKKLRKFESILSFEGFQLELTTVSGKLKIRFEDKGRISR